MSFDRVCVYCASSRQTDAAYYEAAVTLGRSLAERGATIVYGGGAVGSMGALADAALAAGGTVIGVLPRFMDPRHRAMWTVVDSAAAVVDAIHEAPPWGPEARRFALV